MIRKIFKLMPGRDISMPTRNDTLISVRAAFAVSAILAAAALFSSCSPRATITLPADSTAPTGALFGTAFTPASEALIRKLTGLGANSAQTGGAAGSGNQTGSSAGNASAASASIFDAPGITASLKTAGLGVQSVTVDGASLAVSTLVAKPETLLGGAVSVKPGEKTFKVIVDRKTVNAAIGLMPASTRDYLDLLMAPVFTGDAMTAAEYRDLVGAAYGKTISAEIDAARFTLTVKAPGPVKSAKISPTGGNAANGKPAATTTVDTAATGSTAANSSTEAGTVKKAGTEAVFTIPLITLLVLESPLAAEVTW